MRIYRSLISVSNRTNLKEFTHFLDKKNIEIYGTDGTLEYLKNNNLSNIYPVTKISNYKSILNGRVKTLHPKIFGSLLTTESIKEDNIIPIQLLVCNLYPFADKVNLMNDEETILENIDIGGHAMIRSAIKNYKNVLPIVNPDDYKLVMDNWYDINDTLLAEMAHKASKYIYKYDYDIYHYFKPTRLKY